jgi:hypothetical protein
MRRDVVLAVFSALVTAVATQGPATASMQGSTIIGIAPGAQAPVPGMPQLPPRDGRPGEKPVKGTGVIRGVIVAADTGTPLRRVHVRVMGERGPVGGLAETDAQGRFEVAELPAGRYHVSVSKSGYVSQSYGQRSPNTPGTPIELGDGQRAERVSFSMTRGGAITGRIVDEFGEPVAGAQVTLQRYAYMNGQRRLVGGGMGGGEGAFDRTDDLGQYRLYGLTPGEYYVTATVRSMEFVMPGMSTPQSSSGFAPTYYPGTASQGSAERVVVKPGLEVPNVSFALVTTRVGRISGRVVTGGGEPAANFMLMIAPRDAAFGMGGMIEGAPVRADGTFVTRPLSPGPYTLTARPQGRPGDTKTEIARMDITVSGEDVENVMLVTGPGGIIRGRIVTDDGTVPPFEPREARIFPFSDEPSRMGFMGPQPDSIRPDWSFELSGLADRVRLRWGLETPGANSSNWSLKSALKDGVDLADTAIEVAPGQVVDDVEIVITQKITEVSGLVLDDRGRPTTDATVVFFAEDKARWTPGSRYMRISRPDTEGKYRVRLTPGVDYLAVVVRTIEDGRQTDPEFLATVAPAATRVTIGEGEKKVLDLRVSGL